MRHSPRRKLQRMTWSSCSREHRAWPGARCGGYAADRQLADAQSCHLRHDSCRLDHETGQGAAPRLPPPRHCECRDQGRQRHCFSVTMGTMSASDAAPLPRLGEVFFDVRGNSRSMRLSWYADTGVAVLSIWRGGMCTGTFRLAIADLPRMVQTLQRGPDGQQPGWDGQAPGQTFADAPSDATAQVRAMGPMSGQMMQPAPADFRDDGPGTPDQERYRNGTTDYLAEPLDNPDQAADHVPGPAPVGYPGEPLPADPRGGTPDYAAEPQGLRTGPAEYPAEPQGPRTRATEYPAAPTGRRGRSGQYPAEPPRPMPEPPAGPVGY